MTNAEYIRNMSTEELALKMVKAELDFDTLSRNFCSRENCKFSEKELLSNRDLCDKCFVNWLNQPFCGGL